MLSISWFVNENFDFFKLLMAIFRFFGMFCLNPLLILKESVGQGKWQRNLGFIFFLYYLLNAIKNLWKFGQPRCDRPH